MFGWLKRLLGIAPPRKHPLAGQQVVLDKEVNEEPPRPKPVPARKPKFDLPNFDNMTKLDIDIWARNEHGINLDRRFKKETMIKELKDKLGEKD